MADLDEISLAIGRIEGKLDGMNAHIISVSKKVDDHSGSQDPHPEASRADNGATLAKIAVGTSVAGLGLHGLIEWLRRHTQ